MVKHLFTDSAYDRGKLVDKAQYHDTVIEVIRRMEGHRGFEACRDDGSSSAPSAG